MVRQAKPRREWQLVGIHQACGVSVLSANECPGFPLLSKVAVV